MFARVHTAFMWLLLGGLIGWLLAGLPVAVVVGRAIAQCDATAARLDSSPEASYGSSPV